MRKNTSIPKVNTENQDTTTQADDILGLTADIGAQSSAAIISAEPMQQSPDPLEPASITSTPVPETVRKTVSNPTPKPQEAYILATVEGEYYARSTEGRHKILKPYKLQFKVPSMERLMPTILKYLLPQKLKKDDPAAVAPRTYHLIDTKAIGAIHTDTSDVRVMTRPALEEVVRVRQLPVNPANYGDDLVAFRNAVIDVLANPDGFEEREAKKLAAVKFADKLAKMNS